MSLGHGASIVRDGLILQLDAANLKSYPGSGLTINDLYNKQTTGTFTSLQIEEGYINFNNSSASTIVFPEIGYTSWSIFYAARPTGTPASNYRGIVRIRDVNGAGYFYSDTREVATPNILHYTKDFNINSWWTRQMLSISDYGTSPWNIYAHTQNGLTVNSYKNGIKLYTDTITQNLTGYTNLNRLDLSPSGNHVIHLGFVLIYSRPISDFEVKQNVEALRGRYGI